MIKMLQFILILLTQLLLITFGQQSSERQTTTGPVLGFRRTVSSRQVDSFYGIPFAKPPVGELRFRPPQSIDPWTTAYNATTQPNCCYQEPFLRFSNFSGGQMWLMNTDVAEDCLYLNVWQPVGGAAKKAVMIWIYGGGFSTGSNTLDWYNGKYLAAEGDVVVMSMQYRGSVFGFGYLENNDDSSDYLKGNIGLLDQALAIKWFYDNVEVFGGDKSRITIFGESAGGASVHYQLVSPLNKNIITGAILQSGFGKCPWGYDDREITVNKTLKLAKFAGCYNGELLPSKSGKISDVTYNKKEIIDCMLALPAEKLSRSHFDYSGPERKTLISFAPTVDGHIVVEPPTAENFAAAANGRPIIISITQNEGYYILASTVTKYFPWKDENPPALKLSQYKEIVSTLLYNENILVQNSIAFEYGTPTVYNKDQPDYRPLLDGLTGDLYFNCEGVDILQQYAKNESEVFACIYRHKSSANTFPDYMGAMHGYEIDAVFGIPLDNDPIFTDDEKVLSRNVLRYWTNFAKNQDPNQNDDGSKMSTPWPRYNAEDRQFFIIDTTTFYTESDFRYRTCSYWKEVVPSLREAGSKIDACERSAGHSSLMKNHNGFLIFAFMSIIALLSLFA